MMGGNALKNCTTRRYDAEEYFELANEVGYRLSTLFADTPMMDIKAYRNKQSFGDLDLVVVSDSLPDNWVFEVVNNFSPREFVKNGNVLSFEFKEFQVDLIATPFSEYETSLNYFAYNDLGNLLGRLAHSMGLKLGHDGLSYIWNCDTYQFKKEIISTDWKEICGVLGVDYDRYMQGFDELEDIFEFVMASPFFHSDIYLLENRNNYARTRDKKRKTYTEFLKYIDGNLHTLEQCKNKFKRDTADKDEWLPYLFSMIDGFEETYGRVYAEWEFATEFKRRYNGDIVRELTGLQNKELGMFMKWMRENVGEVRIQNTVVKLNPELVPRWIMYWFGQYNGVIEVFEYGKFNGE
ncbi:MAG: hypothetical protein ACXW1D_00095 [Halobacteriota archaeon]